MRREPGGRARSAGRVTLLVAVLLVVAACGPSEIDVRAGGPGSVRFVTQVVDARGDVGAGLALAAAADGGPHLVYLAFQPEARPGEPAPASLIDGPALPAVQHADLVGGAWTRSVVAEEAGVERADEAAMALDADDVPHVAWTAGGEILYSTIGDGGVSEPERVAAGDVEGVAIALDGEGTPWVAFYEGEAVRVAGRGGDTWSVEEVGAAREAGGPRTSAVAASEDGLLVAYGDGSRTMLASRAEGGWSAGVVDEEGGRSVTMDVDPEGEPHIAYVTSSGEARHAHGPGGVVFTIFREEGSPETGIGLDLAVDERGVHHIVWSDDAAVRYAQDAAGEFEEQVVPRSEGGSRPQVVLGGAGEVHVAWYEPEGGVLRLATLTDAPEPLLALPGPAATPGVPEPTAPPTGPPPCEPAGTELVISAPPGAAVDGFDTDCLAAPAGEPFTIEFENADPDVPHNVAIYTDESAAQDLFVGETFPGVETVTYEVPALEPGIYFFRCDVHPTTMTGTFVVA